MKIRKNILPRTLTDAGCCLLITLGIPVTFVFEITVLLPEFHDYGSLFYNFTIIAGVFLVFNIKTNMLTCMFTDTSIRRKCIIVPKKTSTHSNNFRRSNRPTKRQRWCRRLEILCYLWGLCSAKILALQYMQNLHLEKGPSLHVHSLLHWS